MMSASDCRFDDIGIGSSRFDSSRTIGRLYSFIRLGISGLQIWIGFGGIRTVGSGCCGIEIGGIRFWIWQW